MIRCINPTHVFAWSGAWTERYLLRRTGGARCEPRLIRNWMVGQSVDAERQSSCSRSVAVLVRISCDRDPEHLTDHTDSSLLCLAEPRMRRTTRTWEMSSVIFLFLVCLLLLTTSTYTQLPYCYAEPVRSMTDQKRHVHAGGGTARAPRRRMSSSFVSRDRERGPGTAEEWAVVDWMAAMPMLSKRQEPVCFRRSSTTPTSMSTSAAETGMRVSSTLG
jgi:hypothetical protein